MRIEIWSDVVCPWCYIGKRRLEAALAEFAHGDEVEVVYRSFELDPTRAAGAGGDGRRGAWPRSTATDVAGGRQMMDRVEAWPPRRG